MSGRQVREDAQCGRSRDGDNALASTREARRWSAGGASEVRGFSVHHFRRILPPMAPITATMAAASPYQVMTKSMLSSVQTSE